MFISKGLISPDDAEEIIKGSARLAEGNPVVGSYEMNAMWNITCQLLDLPNEQYEYEDEDDA